jgi:hypothetical protein
VQTLVRNSTARLRIFYADGSWSHALSGERFALDIRGDGLTLEIHLSDGPGAGEPAAKGALREFLLKRHLVDSIQIGKTAIRRLLATALRRTEHPEVSVALRVAGKDFTYPASVIVGPDAVTLNLG